MAVAPAWGVARARRGAVRLGRLVLVAVAMVVVTACAHNPATGERQLVLIGEDQEIELGRAAAEEVRQSIGLYDDPELGRYVDRVARRLVAVAERPDLPWTFQVVDDAAVNAFALPGGFIYVTRGLLGHVANEAQLAAVLGHEIGHVTGRHSVEQLSKAQLAQLGLVVGMALSDEVRRLGSLGAAGLGLLFLKFSRDDEHEADQLGLRYAYRADYDVRELPEVFAMLERVSQASGAGSSLLPTWLATHPSPEDRIERTRERLAELDLARTDLTEGRQPHLDAIAGMVYGPDPRHGYFDGGRFYHPELAFSFAVPPRWEASNLRQAVIALSPAQDAAVELSLVPADRPDRALAAFANQDGVRLVGTGGADVPGLPSASARFAVATDQGELAGLVTYVRYRARTFQILAYTRAQQLGAYQDLLARVATSFAPLTDARRLGVRPAYLEVVRVSRTMTLAELHRSLDTSVSVEELALLNQLEPTSMVRAGERIKWVRGGSAPGQLQSAR